MSNDKTEWTTITVPKSVKKDLDTHRDGRSWGSFLEHLRREHADPLTINDAEEIAECVSNSVAADLDADRSGDIQERLDTIEAAAKEATNAAQSADRKLEELR